MADHAHSAAPASAQGHGHVNRKMYLVVFVILAVLTVVEVLIAGASLLSRVSLVSLALIKAAFVAYYFMHLQHERKVMRWMVAGPFVFPALYAVVLIAEASWRLGR